MTKQQEGKKKYVKNKSEPGIILIINSSGSEIALSVKNIKNIHKYYYIINFINFLLKLFNNKKIEKKLLNCNELINDFEIEEYFDPELKPKDKIDEKQKPSPITENPSLTEGLELPDEPSPETPKKSPKKIDTPKKSKSSEEEEEEDDFRNNSLSDSSSSSSGGMFGGGIDKNSYARNRILGKNSDPKYAEHVFNYKKAKNGNYTRDCVDSYGTKGNTTQRGQKVPIVVDRAGLEKIYASEGEPFFSGPKSFSNYLTTKDFGGLSKNELYYICPKYWDVTNELSLDPEQLENFKHRISYNVFEKGKKIAGQDIHGKYIKNMEDGKDDHIRDQKVQWGNLDKTIKQKDISEYQYFRVKPKHFDIPPEIPGYPGIKIKYIPCCDTYTTKDKYDKLNDHKNIFKDEDAQGKNQKEKSEKDPTYHITKGFPCSPEGFGYLHDEINTLFFQDEDKIQTNQKGFLRKGIKLNDEIPSFISAFLIHINIVQKNL